jgi:hypothetical protein
LSVGLRKVRFECAELPSGLPPFSSRRSQRELGRRRDELRRLQAERARLRQVDKTYISSTDRDSLLVAGDGRSYGKESEVTRDLTTQQLVDRSQAEMKAQDEILDQMSRGLDGLKNMGVTIRDETALHMVRLGGRRPWQALRDWRAWSYGRPPRGRQSAEARCCRYSAPRILLLQLGTPLPLCCLPRLGGAAEAAGRA